MSTTLGVPNATGRATENLNDSGQLDPSTNQSLSNHLPLTSIAHGNDSQAIEHSERSLLYQWWYAVCQWLGLISVAGNGSFLHNTVELSHYVKKDNHQEKLLNHTTAITPASKDDVKQLAGSMGNLGKSMSNLGQSMNNLGQSMNNLGQSMGILKNSLQNFKAILDQGATKNDLKELDKAFEELKKTMNRLMAMYPVDDNLLDTPSDVTTNASITPMQAPLVRAR